MILASKPPRPSTIAPLLDLDPDEQPTIAQIACTSRLVTRPINGRRSALRANVQLIWDQR